MTVICIALSALVAAVETRCEVDVRCIRVEGGKRTEVQTCAVEFLHCADNYCPVEYRTSLCDFLQHASISLKCMEGALLSADYEMTAFLSQLLQDPSRVPAYIWELEKLSTQCALRIARLSKQTNSLMMDKLVAVGALRTELTQKVRQLERLQLRLQKLQLHVVTPFLQVEEGTARYQRLVEVGEKLRDLQTCLVRARRGDAKGVEELSRSLPGIEIVQSELSRLSSKPSSV